MLSSQCNNRFELTQFTPGIKKCPKSAALQQRQQCGSERWGCTSSDPNNSLAPVKNMEIRGARESELEQVVELCCVAFNPDGHERYWQYVRGDSSYRLPQTRVVVVNDRVVSTLRVWERRMRVGASLVTMGGIGGVCTHPNYRGVGYASALMRDTIDYLRTTGCDLGVLFTIIPEAFYRRLGWTSLPLHGFNITCNASTREADSSEWQVTDFNPETDLDAVAALYDLTNAKQSGTIARTRAYWDMAPSRIRGVLPTVIAHQNGYIGGYLNYGIGEKRAEVCEVGYAPDNPPVLDALVSHFLRACESQKVEKINGRFPSQHPFVERLIAECNSPVTPTEYTGMMLYAVNLPVLLRRLVVGWESHNCGCRRDVCTTCCQTAYFQQPTDSPAT